MKPHGPRGAAGRMAAAPRWGGGRGPQGHKPCAEHLQCKLPFTYKENIHIRETDPKLIPSPVPSYLISKLLRGSFVVLCVSF